MHPNISSAIASERSQDLRRRAADIRLAEATVNVSRASRPRHEISGAVRRYFHRPSFAR